MSATERILADHVTIEDDDPEDACYWAAMEIIQGGKRPTVIRRRWGHGRQDPVWEMWQDGAYRAMVFHEAELAAWLLEQNWEVDDGQPTA